MTRRSVYGLGLSLTLACKLHSVSPRGGRRKLSRAGTVMTIASIVMPRWISPSDKSQPTIGLHKSCSRLTGTCTSYPRESQCVGNFCHIWRTVGFLLSFGVVIELATLVSFAVIIAGGVQRRVAGWKIITGLLAFGGVVLCAGMAIVASLSNNPHNFPPTSHLGTSWTLCAASFSTLLVTALGITGSALYLPTEGDYELIPDYPETQQDEQLLSRIAGWNDGYGSGRSYEN
ncbi:hypothetical protein B0J11DRAFT_158581 [Dendryphion nanum]|uniref:Uncharacterized protein n=1 Tax=Dendryphion nanum TaxID=256645 RepID=A0A9P9IX15_9PLEO|nr:hypothetical protein B0J11DRAFT_158581 [Dendryphion nanum]